jgi:hypothetical protein
VRTGRDGVSSTFSSTSWVAFYYKEVSGFLQHISSSDLQHFGRNSHDALGDFLVQGAVFGIVGGIVEPLATEFVLEFVQNCVAEHDQFPDTLGLALGVEILVTYSCK